MPHVVLNGSVTFKEIFRNLIPLVIRDEGLLLKTSKKYIESEGNSILLEALAIEKDKKTSFLILLGNRKDSLVIRIYPGSIVEKTDGVKRILAEIAKQILENFPNLNVGKTNLQEYL